MDCSCYDVNPSHRDDPDHCLNCGICIVELTGEEKARLARIDGRWTLLPAPLLEGHAIVYLSDDGKSLHTNVNGRFRRVRGNRILKYLKAGIQQHG